MSPAPVEAIFLSTQLDKANKFGSGFTGRLAYARQVGNYTSFIFYSVLTYLISLKLGTQ